MDKFYEIIPNGDGSVTILLKGDPGRILPGLFAADPEALEDDLMERFEEYWKEAEVIKWPY